MNWKIQRKMVKPNGKSCNWCKNFNKDFECMLKGIKNNQLTHRLYLKIKRENYNFRYCKNYKFSKINFNKYKEWIEENGKIKY